jgi:ABC-2 type transport system permease protein
MFAAAGIAAGSAAIAGEEEAGTLELLLATPLTRRRLVLEKLGALVAELVALALVLWLSLWLSALAADMDISAGRLAAATLSLLLFSAVVAAFALLVGAATGRRGLAVAASAALALAAYVIHSLAALVDVLEVPQRLSPYYYYVGSDPLARGLDPWHALVLLALAVVVATLAVPAFERRDVRVP